MADRALGVAAVLLAAALLLASYDLYVPYQYEPLGPKVFPMLVAALLGGAALALLLRPEAMTLAVGVRHAIVLAVLLGYALAYERLGFAVSTALMTLALGPVLGLRKTHSLAAAAVLAVGGFVLLRLGLDLELPRGSLWTIDG